jgi:hypothetical protein
MISARLREAAWNADGVIDLAFSRELMRSGGFAAAVAAELAVVPALGAALAGTGKPLVPASGTGASGQLDGPGTEE